eukprot:scaffold2069_cov187-Amphora_coffeaeformis.AAC.28
MKKESGSSNDEPSKATTTTTTTITTAHCTAALPGQVFQEIYVCRTCYGGGTTGPQDTGDDDDDDDDPTSLPLCLCQACAETCHANCQTADGEDAVDYIGVGPASCDCHTRTSTTNNNTKCAGCQLYQDSCDFARQHNLLVQNWDASCTLPRSNNSKQEECPVQVFDIPELQRRQSSMAQQVMAQAQVLVQHSKDTFWIDAPAKSSTNDTATYNDSSRQCLLEKLAYEILRFHSQKDGVSYRGCEWWVQVKPITTQISSSSNDTNTDEKGGAKTTTNRDIMNTTTAIEMHYDKDEDLAESFGLGVFPTYSTVTYLTTGGTAPTLIFPHTYHDPADTPLPHVYVSRPVQGKHLVFDGSLLHGAIPLIFDQQPKQGGTSQDSDETEPELRVTFLVNLWKDHRPMGIQNLPSILRETLQRHADPEALDLFGKNIPIMVARESIVIPSRTTDSQEWISLPFVQDGMIVKTVVLPEFADDVVLIRYEEGFEARLDYPSEDDAIDEEDEFEATASSTWR